MIREHCGMETEDLRSRETGAYCDYSVFRHGTEVAQTSTKRLTCQREWEKFHMMHL